ncbi:hypothetical protein I79_026117 [Cricetulus griseus]|uniref:Uncharacterized protein n=1 Tax=Cricetulus griseus TaxID=10029 RepID=G3IQ29_CRIGR|nr:hypothetical protein I79_026117 [Cricetulus griseus]
MGWLVWRQTNSKNRTDIRQDKPHGKEMVPQTKITNNPWTFVQGETKSSRNTSVSGQDCFPYGPNYTNHESCVGSDQKYSKFKWHQMNKTENNKQ